MGISVFIKDADFTNPVGSIHLPNREGLVGEWFFGGTESNSFKNRAGNTVAVKVGEPTVASNYLAVMGGTNYVELPIPTLDNSKGVTIIAVSKGATRNTLGHTGFYANPPGFLGFFHLSGYRVYSVETSGDNFAAILPVNIVPNDTWMVMAGVMEERQKPSNYIWNNGVKTSAVSVDEPVAGWPAINKFIIGAQAKGNDDWAYAAIFNRKLSAAELDAAYAGIKQLLAVRGIDIT